MFGKAWVVDIHHPASVNLGGIYSYVPDALRRPPPTPQDSFVGVSQGNLSEGRCSLARKTAELVDNMCIWKLQLWILGQS